MSECLNSHIVICNWNEKGDAIIKELHSSVHKVKKPIVIITKNPQIIPSSAEEEYEKVFIISGDPTDENILKRASLESADSAIVLSDFDRGEYADAYSIIIALAIEGINKDIYTIVELQKSRNKIHFKNSYVDEIICVEEITEKLAAQSTLNHGISYVYLHLLSATLDTNEIYIIPLPDKIKGMEFSKLMHKMTSSDIGIILIGYISDNKVFINPKKDESLIVLKPGDKLITIAYEKPEPADFEEI